MTTTTNLTATRDCTPLSHCPPRGARILHVLFNEVDSAGSVATLGPLHQSLEHRKHDRLFLRQRAVPRSHRVDGSINGQDLIPDGSMPETNHGGRGRRGHQTDRESREELRTRGLPCHYLYCLPRQTDKL